MALHGPKAGRFNIIEVKFASFLQAATRCQADKGAASNQFTRHGSGRSTAHHSVHKFQVIQSPSFLSIVSFSRCEFFLGNGAWVPEEHNSLQAAFSIGCKPLAKHKPGLFQVFAPGPGRCSRMIRGANSQFFCGIRQDLGYHKEALTATLRNHISRQISTRLQALCGWGIRVFEQGNLEISNIRRLPIAKKTTGHDKASRNILTKATGRLLTKEWTHLQVFGFQFPNQGFLSCGIRVIS